MSALLPLRFLQENRLMVADPKALQYILHTSGYNFPKAPDASHTIRMLTGDGVGCTKGKLVEA